MYQRAAILDTRHPQVEPITDSVQSTDRSTHTS